MNKILIVIIIFALILIFPQYILGASNKTHCEYVLCVPEGNKCNPHSLGSECEYGTYCLIGKNKSPVCTKYADVGETCSSSHLCWPDLRCESKGHRPVSICQNLGYLAAGEECRQSSECATNNLICKKGICHLRSSTCSSPEECDHDHFCQAGKCMKRVGEGKICRARQECKVGFLCSGGVCMKPFQLEEGAACHYHFDYNSGGVPLIDCNIGKGLYCDFEDNKDIGKCTKFQETDGPCDNHNAKCQWMEQSARTESTLD
ncbi:paramecium surface antigen repeat-containing protein [Heterostelium album PN500]|uniref:Paramecium surface antigen repeat-containing protein n=1 Tax=Heterostelium pallidum (strain ATCC 26659 / Pp 5 / PN500) TaxID=670386 RepID=D3B1A6_HETP5|nr:paramecium surface antigen repeat-containing protein [Heterostelium album PN500]EFA85080.1 paramecium surface antigen repeat-containing protein [Heterostelium album PN500]|eukprot:XP_020437190.1 paramecium surface antigen repeat-containing protein [Heterostelium album PN500]